MNEQIAKIIDFSLFGTTDGDLIPDEDASIPVGEYRRLIREEAIPALVRAGLLRDPADVLQSRIDTALEMIDNASHRHPVELDRIRAALSGPASPPAAEPLSPAPKEPQSGADAQPGFRFGDKVAWTDSDGDWHGGTLVGFFRAEGDEWWAVEDELGFVHDVHERDFLTRLRPAPTAGEA
jgi:hypothetical protein